MTSTHIVLPSKPKIIKEDSARGTYEIEGLYPGYGHTLGNSLRRIILSSLVGSAITSVKINGVTHEFATISGVKEDAVMMVLNLKKIRFRVTSDEPQRITLEVKGVKTVTAADLNAGGQVEIANPDQIIATLTDKKASLELEVTVEKGLGYQPKEMRSRENHDIGTVFLDAIFTPIRRVNYEVENMRVGDRTDYNRLRITIETDGTVTPHAALEQSIATMINQLQAIVGFEVSPPEAPTQMTVGGGESRSDKLEILKMKVDDLALSVRTANALTSDGIRTVGGLARKKEEDLLGIAGLGEKGLQEIKKALGEHGLTLK